MSAVIIPFPRPDLCRELARYIPTSDPDRLAELLRGTGFANRPDARQQIEWAREAFQGSDGSVA